MNEIETLAQELAGTYFENIGADISCVSSYGNYLYVKGYFKDAPLSFTTAKYDLNTKELLEIGGNYDFSLSIEGEDE